MLDIVSGGACKDLHEKLYECHRVTAIPVPANPGYGQCVRDKKLGVFKVGHERISFFWREKQERKKHVF